MVELKNFICETCGVQYKSSNDVPEKCVICNEERQYVSFMGQTWTTLEEMIQEGTYRNTILSEDEGLYSLHTKPNFGIGQTAYFVKGYEFNLLWDCLTYLDQSTSKEISDLGGIDAIALSHPHYYSSQVEWAEAFDVPIYIHEDDKEWVMRPSEKIIYWSGESLELHEDFVLHHIGGHFKGAVVLEWRSGNNGKGTLLSGDIVRVVADRDWVSFMYSYPNFIPLPASTVENIAAKLEGLKFNRLYDAFHRAIEEDANVRVQASAKRYLDALNGVLFST